MWSCPAHEGFPQASPSRYVPGMRHILVFIAILAGCGVHIGTSLEEQEAQTKTPKAESVPPEPNVGRRNRSPTEPAPAITVDLEKVPPPPPAEQ